MVTRVSYTVELKMKAIERQRYRVAGYEHIPIEVAILAVFLFYRYKFLSQAKDKNAGMDKNIVRLPIRRISNRYFAVNSPT